MEQVNIIDSKYLTFVDHTKNHHKFYRLTRLSNGKWMQQNGRIDTIGASRLYSLVSYNETFNRKLDKGYVLSDDPCPHHIEEGLKKLGYTIENTPPWQTIENTPWPWQTPILIPTPITPIATVLSDSDIATPIATVLPDSDIGRLCYCGSGKKFRQCHGKVNKIVKKIDKLLKVMSSTKGEKKILAEAGAVLRIREQVLNEHKFSEQDIIFLNNLGHKYMKNEV